MTVNIGGVLYEGKVRDAIKEALTFLPDCKLLDESSGAFNPHTNDLTLEISGRKIDIEIKRFNAQMGEGSIGYTEGKFHRISQRMDPGIFDIAISYLMTRQKELDALLLAIKKESFPARVTKSNWTLAVQQGLSRVISGKILLDEDMVCKHYNSKGVYYMQIEKRGLYYLGSNPLNLPVPPLKADTNMLVRMKRAGSQLSKSGELLATVGIISTGRLKIGTCPKSNFSLDCPQSTIDLFKCPNQSQFS